jgi:hypothetical protein
MVHSAEQAKRILAEQKIMRSGEATDASLCQYRNVSCVRCCLPHIGGDSHLEDSTEKRAARFKRNNLAYHLKYSGRYLGPGNIVMKLKNFNPLKDPQIEASKYEDSFPDVGRKEMERRFSERRDLFLDTYDREEPRQSLPQYMKAAQRNEGYKYKPEASMGLVSLFLGGLVSTKHRQKGELPECQLLGFVNGERTVGCMAHPLAETSQGYDGRDQVGFFNHTDGCRSAGCEASKEFRFLSLSAMKIFDKAVNGMSWYEYSRHATSVLVYYLRGYDCLLQMLDEGGLLDTLTLEQLVQFTNTLYDEWPMRKPDWSMRHLLNAIRIPEFPMSGIELATSSLDWFTGTTTEHVMPDSTEPVLEDVRRIRDKLTLEVPFSLRSTDKGYRFMLTFPAGERGIEVHLRNGNRPVLIGTLVPELWRVGINRGESWSGTDLAKGKKSLLQNLHRHLSYDSDTMNSLDILSTDIPLAERMMYIALDTWFLKDHFGLQLRQARDHVKRRIDALRNSPAFVA